MIEVVFLGCRGGGGTLLKTQVLGDLLGYKPSYEPINTIFLFKLIPIDIFVECFCNTKQKPRIQTNFSEETLQLNIKSVRSNNVT